MNAIFEHIRARGVHLRTLQWAARHLRISAAMVLDPATARCAPVGERCCTRRRAATRARRDQPAVRQGRVVLCDRYVDSSVVYRGAGRGGHGPGMAINAFATGGTMRI